MQTFFTAQSAWQKLIRFRRVRFTSIHHVSKWEKKKRVYLQNEWSKENRTRKMATYLEQTAPTTAVDKQQEDNLGVSQINFQEHEVPLFQKTRKRTFSLQSAEGVGPAAKKSHFSKKIRSLQKSLRRKRKKKESRSRLTNRSGYRDLCSHRKAPRWNQSRSMARGEKHHEAHTGFESSKSPSKKKIRTKEETRRTRTKQEIRKKKFNKIYTDSIFITCCSFLVVIK